MVNPVNIPIIKNIAPITAKAIAIHFNIFIGCSILILNDEIIKIQIHIPEKQSELLKRFIDPDSSGKGSQFHSIVSKCFRKLQLSAVKI